MQWQEMQWRHEEEQQLLVQMEEVAKLRWAECMAQKARRKAEEKAREEAERQRVVEDSGVPPTASRQGTRGRSCPIEEG